MARTPQSLVITERSGLFVLRADLDAAERQVVVIHETAGGAAELLLMIDRINAAISALAAQHTDVRAEEARADGLNRRIIREALRIVKLVQAGGATEQLAGSAAWQAVQAAAAQRRRMGQRRLVLGAGLVVVVGLLLFVVLPWAFPPQPTANLIEVQQLAARGDYAAALVQARAEQARVPTDEQAALWVGALALRQGDNAAAEAAWATAQKLYNNDASFWLDRGLTLSLLGNYSEAEADAQALLAQPATAAAGQFLLGQIYEQQGDVRRAMAAFEQAGTLADQAGNTNLTVMARTRMAYLAQRLPVAATATP